MVSDVTIPALLKRAEPLRAIHLRSLVTVAEIRRLVHDCDDNGERHVWARETDTGWEGWYSKEDVGKTPPFVWIKGLWREVK